MQLIFFPVDATYRIEDSQPVIYLFGRTIDGKKICVKDRNFKPYFYSTCPKEALQNITAKDNIQITQAIPVQKILNGKPIALHQCFVKIPAHIPMLREILPCENYECDIPYVRRYFLDKQLEVRSPLQIEGDFVTDIIFEASSLQQGSQKAPDPSILAIDIETYGLSMDPVSCPIIMIAAVSDKTQTLLTWKPTQHAEVFPDERAMLQRFFELLENEDADLLVGYNSDRFDLPYILQRAKILGIEWKYGQPQMREREFKLTGIVHVDLYAFVKRALAQTLRTTTFKLGAVTKELLGKEKHDVDIKQLSKAWDNGNFDEFCLYNLNDAQITYELALRLFPSMEEIAKISSLPLFDATRSGFSQLVENYILKKAVVNNQLAPNKAFIRRGRYAGAFVYEPKPGVYKDLVVFDFRSLYPSIITAHNIDPGTLHCSCCSQKVPGTNHWFCSKNKGFLSSILEEIIQKRIVLKDQLKQNNEPLLHARSGVLKLLANAFYGYFGFSGARWYCEPCASSVTAYARDYIQWVIKNAQKEGFKVIYSDTDSIFLELENKTKQDAFSFVQKINEQLPGLMELDFEKYYPKGIFVFTKNGIGAKKRYALADETGKLKIRGFETVRRNVSPLAKKIQLEVLKKILLENDIKGALESVHAVVKALKQHTIPKQEVMITTQLQRLPDDYSSEGPHVAAARKLQQNGVKLEPGMFISYIIGKGRGTLKSRVMLIDETKDYDEEYYIEHQVIASVEKILETAGCTLAQIRGNTPQKTLAGFVKS